MSTTRLEKFRRHAVTIYRQMSVRRISLGEAEKHVRVFEKNGSVYALLDGVEVPMEAA